MIFQLFIDASSTRRDSEDNKDEGEEDFFENQTAQAVKEASPEQSDTEFPSLVRSSNGSSATTVNKSAPTSTGVCIRTALSMMSDWFSISRAPCLHVWRCFTFCVAIWVNL